MLEETLREGTTGAEIHDQDGVFPVVDCPVERNDVGKLRRARMKADFERHGSAIGRLLAGLFDEFHGDGGGVAIHWRLPVDGLIHDSIGPGAEHASELVAAVEDKSSEVWSFRGGRGRHDE